MKKAFLSTCLCFFALCHFGQSTPQRILGTFIYKSKPFNFDFTQESLDNYALIISTIDDGKKGAAEEPASGGKEVVAGAEASEKPDYIFSSFNLEVFKAVFLDQMQKKYEYDPTDRALLDKAVEVFTVINTRLGFIDDEPVTAYLILKKDFIYSFLKRHPGGYYDGRLGQLLAFHYVHRVNVETEDGAIKNITVQLVDTLKAKLLNQSPRSYLEFKNQYPISISGKFDSEKLADVDLHCMNCGGIKGLSRYIKLSDLLLLDIVLENDKEDYSPSNRTVSLSPGKAITELKKEKRSRILEVAAFSDFIGLNQEEPNGLIQIEAKRKININTKSKLFLRTNKDGDFAQQMDFGEDSLYQSESTSFSDKDSAKKFTKYVITKKLKPGMTAAQLAAVEKSRQNPIYVTVRNRPFRSPYYSFFTYVEPRLLFSKLEENRKYLPVDTFKTSAKGLDPLRLFQYQTMSFGAQLNVARFNFPQLKLNWNVINTSYYWFRTRLQHLEDSATKKSTPLNSSYWQIGTSVVFRPDSRWGVSMGFDYIHLGLWNHDYDVKDNDGLMQIGVDAHLKTTESSKVFFRFKWTHEQDNNKNNFTQMQLGYSLMLFAGGSESIKKVE